MPNGSVTGCGKRCWELSNAGAYTLIDLVVGLCLVALFTSIMVPAIIRHPRCTCQRINCTNNLKQIGLSFRQWALDNQDLFPMQVSVTNGGTMELVNNGTAWVHFNLMSNELNTPKILFCPNERDKRRIPATAFGTPQYSCVRFSNDNNLSYFVGVDATQTNPSMFLAGDRNLTNNPTPKRGLASFAKKQAAGWTRELHDQSGNIAFSDGSVQQFTTPRLRIALAETGDFTNRLAMP